MANLPSASVAISAEAGALAGGTGYHVVMGCVERNADLTARVYSSAKSLIAQHGYSSAVDYAALFMEGTRKPVIFVALPTVTPATSGHLDASGMLTSTSVISVAPGAAGYLDETDGVITVTTGGTIGTNGIVFTLSLDGGVTAKAIRLGTATTYTVPYVGVVISFAAGTLDTGAVYRFVTTAPKWDGAGITAARLALASQQKLARSWMVIGPLANATEAGYITTAVNAYETQNARFTYARASLRDRLPLPAKSKITGQTLTFAEVGIAGDTITRTAGSWITDGFAVGDNITIAGSTSNNITTTGGITALTATILTLGTDDLAAEAATPSVNVTITKAQTKAAWIAELDAAFATVDGQKRIDLGVGRLRKLSPITGWEFRRPVQWAASIREYQHDLHHPTWAKQDGPLLDWSMLDNDDVIAEFDERTDGGALAARFTCARTWGNGPNGAFIAQSLTRDSEGSLLSFTHNMAVANLGCTIVQSATENIIGQTPVLNLDGTATTAALQVIEEAINTQLEQALLREFVPGEGPRASLAVWRASGTDDLSDVDATLTGVLDLHVNGTVVHVNTLVKVS